MRNWARRSPVTIGVVLVAAGFVVLFLGWNGAAGVDFVQGQVPYLISGGLVGVSLVAVGLTTVVVQARRQDSADLAARVEELTDVVRRLEVGPVAGPTAVPAEGPLVVAVAGRSTYHQPDCRLVADRDDVQAMAPTVADARGLSRCRVCRPPVASAGA